MLTNITPRANASRHLLAIRTIRNRPNGWERASVSKLGHRQQIRAYRFGIWTSHLNPEFQRDLRRRQRIIKYKYAESISRRLSWDQSPFVQDSRAILRRLVGRYWQSSTAPYGSRFVNTDGRTHDKRPTPVPGKGSARTSVYTSSGSGLGSEFVSWKSGLDDVVNTWTKQSSQGAKRARPTSTTEARSPSVEAEYVIDPITNRKVPKKMYGPAGATPKSPETTFKSYRSQFSMFTPPEYEIQEERQPVHSNGPPPKDELTKYSEIEIDPLPTKETYSTLQTGLAQSEEYSLNHLPPEEVAEVQDELHDYRPSQYDEVQKANEGHEHEYEDLDKYRPSEFQDDLKAEHPAPPTYGDLKEYNKPYHSQEDKVRSEPNHEHEDLHKYRPTSFDDPNSVEVETPFKQYGDLNRYKAIRFEEHSDRQTRERDVAAKFPNLDEIKDKSRGNLEQSMSDHITASDAADKEAVANIQESRKMVKSEEKSNTTGNFVRDFPEDFSKRWVSSSAGLQPQIPINTSVSARDIENEVQNAEKLYADQLARTANSSALESALDRQNSSKIQTALDRKNRNKMSAEERRSTTLDPYSKKAQGLETSYADECGSEKSRETYVKTYGSFEKSIEDKTASAPSAVPIEELLEDIPKGNDTVQAKAEPMTYKILAYDPTMQSVGIAETTSVVADQASPLTPSEVLLRLSNPAKFFPHFAPLQAQGFEIVSGSGDVLVFRKVREASTPPPVEIAKPRPVNPIDLMGQPPPLPNAASFASPTGFLNYDNPLGGESMSGYVPYRQRRDTIQYQTEEPGTFKSQIDVRREEPVFSGPRSSPEKKPKKRRLLRRVVVSGIGVAGIAYAVGVIAEFFTSGGMDGRGPTGF